MDSDVLIIGGGVIGMAIARELRARGIPKVTIADRGELGGEASWAAAGMLAPNIEAGTSAVFHRLCTESLELYPKFAADLLDETGVDIELDRSGTLCLAFNEGELDALQKHVERGFQQLSGDEIRQIEPWVSEDVIGGVLFPDDWQVENRKLIVALRRSLESTGVRILEGAEVSEVIVEEGVAIGARGKEFELYAGTTVLATGAWTTLIQTGESAMPFSVKPIRGQMAAFQTTHRQIGHVVFSVRGYLVPRSDGRVLIGATVEDVGFDNATTDEGIATLSAAAIEIAPRLAEFPIADRWSGLRPFVVDGLPVLGGLEDIDDLILATAHFRNGILLAPLTGKLIAGKILGQVDSEFFVSFGAGRFRSPAMNASATI
jgi:glycine oxidase